MVSKLSGSVSSYRTEDVNKRYIHIEDVMDMFGLEREEALAVALAAGARYQLARICLLYTSPSPRDTKLSRMPSSA